MPEGDTIHKVAAYLTPRLKGRTLAAGRIRGRPLIELRGRRIEDVHVHGKNLFFDLDDACAIRSHLGMNGTWHRYRKGERWQRPRRQAALEITVGDVVFVCFNAEEVEVVRAGGVRERSLATRLGPDLIADERPDEELLDRIIERARNFLDGATTLGDVLLDQRLAAGLGNVYKNELLFLEGHHPEKPLSHVSDDDLRRLYAEGRRLLRLNLGPGLRVTRFENDGRGRHWVYGRVGFPCVRCGARIRYRRLGRRNRSTYWCPRCQPRRHDHQGQKNSPHGRISPSGRGPHPG